MTLPLNAIRGVRAVALLAPIALLVSMAAFFSGLVETLGLPHGYNAAFAAYWLLWGVVVPWALLGSRGIRDVLHNPEHPFGRPPWVGALALGIPVAGAWAYALAPHLGQVSPLVVVVMVARAVLNGTAEELFWRGTFVRLFPTSPIAGWLYPAVLFAVWHVIPLGVIPSQGGQGLFLFGSLLIGLGYGWVAWTTGSIRWTILAHVLVDSMGVRAALFTTGMGG